MVNIRYIVSQSKNATPTGYPFTYSSSHHQSPPGIPLFKRVLYMLCDLNTHVIAPHYNLNILGMARMENDITDILLCKDSDSSGWSLLYCETNRNIALVGYSDVSMLSLSGTIRDIDINNPVRLKVHLHHKVLSNDVSEKEYSLISLPEIEYHITGKDPLLQPTSIRDIQKNGSTPQENYMELLENIRDITLAIFKQEKTFGYPEQEPKIYDRLSGEVTLLEQKVEQLLTAQ